MGAFDLDTIVLETVRRQSGNGAAEPRSRFVEDLKLSENGRRSLFSFLVEAFTARGVNLPARGFFLSNFMACTTTADVQTAVRETLSGGRKKSPAPATPPAPAPAPAPAPTTTSAPPSTQAPPKAAPEAPGKSGASVKKPATKRATKKPAAPKVKRVAAKKKPAAKKRPKRK